MMRIAVLNLVPPSTPCPSSTRSALIAGSCSHRTPPPCTARMNCVLCMKAYSCVFTIPHVFPPTYQWVSYQVPTASDYKNKAAGWLHHQDPAHSSRFTSSKQANPLQHSFYHQSPWYNNLCISFGPYRCEEESPPPWLPSTSCASWVAPSESLPKLNPISMPHFLA